VPESFFYPVQVNGKEFFVQFYFFQKIKQKHGNFSSIAAYSESISEKYGINVIFLNASMMMEEKTFVCGIFHALEDQLKHGIYASPLFAMNVLMHVYCTRQVAVIKEQLIPGSGFDNMVISTPAVMILVAEENSRENLPALMIELRNSFFLEQLVTIQTNHSCADRQLFTIIREMFSNDFYIKLSKNNQIDSNSINKILRSEMALFSLSLQLKA